MFWNYRGYELAQQEKQQDDIAGMQQRIAKMKEMWNYIAEDGCGPTQAGIRQPAQVKLKWRMRIMDGQIAGEKIQVIEYKWIAKKWQIDQTHRREQREHPSSVALAKIVQQLCTIAH